MELLEEHEIEVVADVRSQPYVSYVEREYFNKAPLKRQLKESGRDHVYLGRELGGRPEVPEFYDNDGKAFYDCLVTTPRFRDGLVRLLKGTLQWKVALMCSAGNPTGCHRRRLTLGLSNSTAQVNPLLNG